MWMRLKHEYSSVELQKVYAVKQPEMLKLQN